MRRFNVDTALNEGKVTVTIIYSGRHDAEIEDVTLNGVDVTGIIHPEDYEFLCRKAFEWADEDRVNEAAYYADLEYERRKEETHA